MADIEQSTNLDVEKMAKLEGELLRLISAVDDRLPIAPPARPRPSFGSRKKTWSDYVEDWGPAQFGAVAGMAALLVTAGWVGSGVFYSSRLKAQVEQEIRPYAVELAGTVTSIQTDLGPRLAAADELKGAIDQARLELVARGEEFENTITKAQGQLLGIRDAAIEDIERRLTDQTDDLTSTLEMIRQRAIELDQGLVEAGAVLAAFDRQLPALTDGFSKVTATLAENRTLLNKTSEEAAILGDMAPPLIETIAGHKSDLEAGTKTLAVLQTQLEALKGQTTGLSQQLEKVLAEGQDQITSWEAMGQQVGSRKREVMRTLDVYADSLNSRVREFLDVLNNETVFTGG